MHIFPTTFLEIAVYVLPAYIQTFPGTDSRIGVPRYRDEHQSHFILGANWSEMRERSVDNFRDLANSFHQKLKS